MTLECPDCGNEQVVTKIMAHNFNAGDTEITVPLPFRVCEHCSLVYLDKEGMDVQDAAVQEHHVKNGTLHEYTFDLRFATIADYVEKRVKIVSTNVASAFKKVAEQASHGLRKIELIDIY